MSRLERLHWVDGLRAVAIALVVFHHSLSRPLQAGLHLLDLKELAPLASYTTASGVELFFVISGIVLLRPYLRSGRVFETRRYLWRRFTRLWPPYAAALVFALVPLWIAEQVPNWYSTELFLPKIGLSGFLLHLPLVTYGATDIYNTAWWSLSVEVVFYATLPLLLLLGRRVAITPGRLVAGLIAAVGLGELLLRTHDFEILRHRDPLFVFGVYLPCFVLGIGHALRDWPRSWSAGALVLGLSAIGIAVSGTPLNYNAAYGFAWAGVVGLVSSSARARHALGHPLLVWFGERSYSLFLTHFSVFYLANQLAAFVTPQRGLLYFALTRGIGLPLAMGIAMLLFHNVEKRFARGLTTGDQIWPTFRRSRAAHA